MDNEANRCYCHLTHTANKQMTTGKVNNDGVVVYEPKDFKRYLGIEPEQFRNWRTHLDPYAPHLSHDVRVHGPLKRGGSLRQCFTAGGLRAFKVIQDLIEKKGLSFGILKNFDPDVLKISLIFVKTT